MSTRTAPRAHTSFSAPKRQLNRVPYLPGLDGMRALAVVAVMLYHANHRWLGGGFLGVEVFFVISGYLITLLLIGEHERTGRVALGKFWMRRFRRLLPAVLTMMSALRGLHGAVQARAAGPHPRRLPRRHLLRSNWYQIFVGQGYTANEAFVPLRHLWSLAVEEQFYSDLAAGDGRHPAARPQPLASGRGVAVRHQRLDLVHRRVAVRQRRCRHDVRAEAMNGYWMLFGRCISINETLYLGTFTRAGGLLLGAGVRHGLAADGAAARAAATRGASSTCSPCWASRVSGSSCGSSRCRATVARPAFASTRGCSEAGSSSPGWRR